jgi:hypothetical protein
MLIYLLFLGFCFSACNTPYYATVNNMGGQPASLTLSNGQTLALEYAINFLSLFSSSFLGGLTELY